MRANRRLGLLLAAVLAAAALAGLWLHRAPADPREVVRRSWSQKGVDKPNVLLITLDTTRADHVGAYGYAEGETPNIDALSRRGVLFAQATSPAPLTLPAHSSIMTGSYPTFHGVRVNGNTALGSAQTTIAETLRERGYATAAWVAAFVLDGRWGLNQGFDVYDDRFDLGKYKHLDLGTVQRPGNEVVDAALAWLDAHERVPFFAWVHLYDPHTPYEPPEPFRTRYGGRGLRGLYDGEIAFADQQVGRCLSWLKTHGLDDRTVVVVMGDHGEALGSHGEASHGYFVYDYALHVPFVLAAPLERLSGVRVASQVSSVDLLPTLFDLLGIAVPARAQGRSLLPEMLDPASGREAYAYAESMTPNVQFGWSALHALRSTRYKLIEAPRPELYDLAADPGETTNVIARHPAVADEMKRRLDRLIAETGKEAPEPEAADLDKETQERLAALGYVGGPVASRGSDPSQPLADPKDKLQVFAAVQQAGELILEESYDAAAKLLESALREEPRMPQALLMLGGAYSELGRIRDARQQFDRVLKDDPKSVQALVGTANLLMREGRTDDVVTLCKRTLSLDERNTQAHVLLGEVYTDRRQPREALPHFERAVEIQPKLTQNRLNLAAALVEVGQHDRAASLLKQIVEEHPRFPLAQFNLGLAYEALGRPAEARAAYAAELEAYPRHFKARFNLGKLQWQLGDRQGSMDAMREVIRTAPKQAEGYLFLARGRLQDRAAIDEVQSLVETGLALAQTPELKALGWMLMADVYNRRQQPEKMNDALRKARGYAAATRPAARQTTQSR